MCGFGGMYGTGLMSGLAGAAVFIVIIAGVWLLARSPGRRTTHPAPPYPGNPAVAALELVKDRYARGDIDHAQLDRELDRLLRGRASGGRRMP